MIMLLVTGSSSIADQIDEFAALFKKASFYHERGDYAHSVPLLEDLIKKSPNNYECNLFLGEDLLHLGDTKAALGPLREAAKVRPEDGTAFTLLADAATRRADYSSAADALESAVSREPESETILLKWADFSLDRTRAIGISLRKTRQGEATMLRATAAGTRDDGERERSLKKSAEEDPTQRGIWGELGAAQIARGESDEARASLKEAAQREPQNSSTLRLEALLDAFDQRWADAETRLATVGDRSSAEQKKSIQSWPDYLIPDATVNGQVWDCLRRKSATCSWPSERGAKESNSVKELYATERWEELVKRTSDVTPSSDSASLWRGVALAEIGDCSRAIPFLEAALSNDGLTAGFWLEICYADVGQSLTAKFKQQGNDAGLHELLGDLSLRLANNGGQAEWEYAEALKLKPKDPQLLARLADSYERMGNFAQAEATAQAALAIDPRESTSLRLLAMMAMNERDYAKAIGRLKALLALEPADDWSRVQLGIAFEQSGNSEEAVRYLTAELKAGYDDPKGILHAMAARALRKTGKDREAELFAAEASRLAQSALKGENSAEPSDQR
jgi:tetratricopeptide (TPR) repeat protein